MKTKLTVPAAIVGLLTLGGAGAFGAQTTGGGGGGGGLACYNYFSDSASYCTSANCGQDATLAPYQGYVKHATWQCCYNSDGTLNKGTGYQCVAQVVSSPNYPYGCCSVVTPDNDVPACNNLSCPPTH